MGIFLFIFIRGKICGLSALRRGRLRCIRPRYTILRFIPAGAGNTAPQPRSPFRLAVCWRGEHRCVFCATAYGFGLSPLARGTQRNQSGCAGGARFIPAGAGNTYTPSSRRKIRTVYPRWRGEHCSSIRQNVNPSGLSPLARGTRQRRTSCRCIHRFIPAGAGNTQTSQRQTF